MTAISTKCYTPEALALFLAGGFPARDLPRLDEHLLECESCRKGIERLWRDDQMQARLQDRKAVQTTAQLLLGDTSSATSEESRDEQFLRQTRRLVDRLLDDNAEPAAVPASTTDLHAPHAAAVTNPVSEGKSPQAATLVAPPRIPGLELGQPIGQGGMGIVYQALDVKDGRVLACKVLSTAFPTSDELDRFDVEARATMRLDHPHIIRVESAGAVDGRPYLVMELASGGTLHKILDGQPQPPTVAADLIAKLADALEHAHRRGVLHRDLKPTNILLVPRQTPETLPQRDHTLADYAPKIADFGIAKLLDSRTLRTQTGQLLGTPAFAAPEQFMAEFGAVGPAADIYSLGAILYLMLTGLPPLPEDNPRRMLALIRHFEPVAPRRLQADVPVDLETICLRCLEKRTRWRYRSAGELALDLRRFLAGKPILARPRNRWRRAALWVSRNRVASGAFVGLAILSAFSFAYAQSQRSIGKMRTASEAQNLELSKAKTAKLNSEAEANQLRTFSALDASNDVKALDYCLQVALSKFAPLAPPANEELSVRTLAKLRAHSILDSLPTIRQRLALPVETIAANASSERRSPRRQLSFNPTSGRLAVTDARGGRVWEVDISTGTVTEQSCALGPFTIDLEWRLLASGDSAGPTLRRTDDSVPPVSLERPVEPPEQWRRLWISPKQDIALALGNRAGQLMCYGWQLPSGRGLIGSVGPLDESTQGIVFINEGAMLVSEERCQSVSFHGGKLIDAGYISEGRIPLHVNHWQWTYDFRGRFDQQLQHPQISMAFRNAVNELRSFTKVTVATVDPSESKLAFGYSNGRVGVIDDIDCGMRFAKCEQLSRPIARIAFSPDSRRLLACSEAGEMLVLDLDEGRLAIPVLPHHHRLVDAAWSPNSRDIAVLDERGLLTVWRVDPLGFRSLASPDGTSSALSTITAASAASANASAAELAATEPLADAASVPHFWQLNQQLDNSPTIVLRDRFVEVWEPSTGTMKHRWPLPRRAVASFPPAEQGGLLLLMEPDEQRRSERAFLNYETGEYWPTSFHALADGRAFFGPTELGSAAFMTRSSYLELWWLQGQRVPQIIPFDTAFGDLYKGCMSPSGRELTVLTSSGKFVVWDLKRNAVRFHGTVANPGTDMNAKYSPDGERLYIYGLFGLRAWESRTTRELPWVESLRRRHVISLDFNRDRSRIVTMCDNRTVEIRDYDSLELLYHFSPNSALTEARFGPEPGTILVGMWNLSDAETNRLYFREMWLPACSEHGHAEMWDYGSGSRISSVFAFRGFGDREGNLLSPDGVMGLDSHRRVRFGRWPTRNAYSGDELVEAGKQFLQRDYSHADRPLLSPQQLVDVWRRSQMANADRKSNVKVRADSVRADSVRERDASENGLPVAAFEATSKTVPGMLKSSE